MRKNKNKKRSEFSDENLSRIEVYDIYKKAEYVRSCTPENLLVGVELLNGGKTTSISIKHFPK